jgi:hypothetical protein
MLAEALTALAAAGAKAVVEAAGTDFWTGIRDRVSVLLGHGDQQRAERVMARLDQTAAALSAQAGAADAELERARQRASWQTRFEDLLEGMTEAEREAAAARLRELAELGQRAGLASAADGVAAGGNIVIHAEGGSVAAGVIHGEVRIENPAKPGPPQG